MLSLSGECISTHPNNYLRLGLFFLTLVQEPRDLRSRSAKTQ